MNRFMTFMEKYFNPVARVLSRNRYLIAIRDGFMLQMPFIVVGSIFMLTSNLPIPGYSDFMTEIFGSVWTTILQYPVDATFSLMAVLVVLGISYNLAKYYKVDGITAAAISFVGFLLLTPFHYAEEGTMIPLEWLGTNGLFLAIIVGIFATECFRFFTHKGWTIKMPAGVPKAVETSFASLIPIAIIVLIFLIIKSVFSFTGFGSLNEFIYQVVQTPLKSLGGGLGATIIVIIFAQLVSFLGMNGAIVNPIMDPIWWALANENLMAYKANEVLPNIITKQFYDNFILMGGSGVTLSLAVMLVIFAKSKNLKTIGRLSTPPGIFNINEPIQFGVPVVFNPLMIIPWVFAPVLICIITYVTMYIGIVPKPNGLSLPWTTPPIISGYLLCGWQGMILQIVELILVGLFYLPFIKIIDKQYYGNEENEESSEKEGTL